MAYYTDAECCILQAFKSKSIDFSAHLDTRV